MSEEPTIGQLIGERVYHYRMKAGISQAELARRVNTSRPNVGRAEKGRHTPSLGWLSRVSKALGVPLVNLVCVLDGIEELEIDFGEEEE